MKLIILLTALTCASASAETCEPARGTHGRAGYTAANPLEHLAYALCLRRARKAGETQVAARADDASDARQEALNELWWQTDELQEANRLSRESLQLQRERLEELRDRGDGRYNDDDY